MKHDHIESNRTYRSGSNILACLLLVALSSSCFAMAQNEISTPSAAGSGPVDHVIQPGQDPRLVTVEELMKLDAQTALRLARQNQHQDQLPHMHRSGLTAQSIKTDRERSESPPVVQAIYGIGRALTAEVQFGQDIHVLGLKNKFVSGHESGALVLEKIDPPCVYVKKNKKTETLCLQRVQP